MRNISGAQIRAARALLRWSAADLVRESGVSPATIHRAESTDGKTTMTFANASAIRRALENAGVELIEENGGGLGARLRRGLEFIDENGGRAPSEVAKAEAVTRRRFCETNPICLQKIKAPRETLKPPWVSRENGSAWVRCRDRSAGRLRRPASSSSTRTVADQACAFESRQSRSGENQRRFCETNPIFSATN